MCFEPTRQLDLGMLGGYFEETEALQFFSEVRIPLGVSLA